MAKLHRLMPDTEFAKAFRVQRVIGEGAMGTVYLVTRVGDGKNVALKVLDEPPSKSAQVEAARPPAPASPPVVLVIIVVALLVFAGGALILLL